MFNYFYVPAMPGKYVLAVSIALLLMASLIFAGKHAIMHKCKPNADSAEGKNDKITAKQLVFCAMSIALGTVLSNIKLFHFPTGGSITLLSMFIICLPGYFFGLGAGLLTGMAYGVLQFLVDPYVLYPMQLVLDYLLAFGSLGLSGLFSNAKNGLLKGYIAGITGRFVFVVISGCIFFGSYAWDGWGVLPYSMAYNGIYIFSEAVITIVIISLPPVKKAIGRIKQNIEK